MPYTAGDQINAALRLIGVLAEGETPSSEASSDSLGALNQMLDSWSIERLAVYTTNDHVFNWPAGTASLTLGPSGTITGARPIQVDDSSYFKEPASGLSCGIKLITQQQYNDIALKTAESDSPHVLMVRPDYPDITMLVHPVPNRVLEFHIISVEHLAQPASLATELLFPPGYVRAFKYNLACEIAPEFGVEPSPTIQRIAMVSKRNLKRVNNPQDLLALPANFGASRHPYDIFAGS